MLGVLAGARCLWCQQPCGCGTISACTHDTSTPLPPAPPAGSAALLKLIGACLAAADAWIEDNPRPAAPQPADQEEPGADDWPRATAWRRREAEKKAKAFADVQQARSSLIGALLPVLLLVAGGGGGSGGGGEQAPGGPAQPTQLSPSVQASKRGAR